MDTMQAKSTLPSKLVWSLVAIIGAISFGCWHSVVVNMSMRFGLYLLQHVYIASHIDFIVYLLQLKYLN
ncbi:hypothetical protein D9M71_434780 [compost metagenome]